MDKNDNVVAAIFENRAKAESAIEYLKMWDKASDDIRLGAIGLLYKEGDEVKAVLGHKGGRGLKVGAVLGIVTGVLTGGVGLAGGAAVGGLMGGVAGSFFSKSLHLSEAECIALGDQLDLGKAAVVVTCDSYELSPTRSTLENLGGVTKVYVVPSNAVDEATDALSDKEIYEIREVKIATEVFDDALTKASDDLGGMMLNI